MLADDLLDGLGRLPSAKHGRTGSILFVSSRACQKGLSAVPF
jgi:hypothetical protein